MSSGEVSRVRRARRRFDPRLARTTRVRIARTARASSPPASPFSSPSFAERRRRFVRARAARRLSETAASRPRRRTRSERRTSRISPRRLFSALPSPPPPTRASWTPRRFARDATSPDVGPRRCRRRTRAVGFELPRGLCSRRRFASGGFAKVRGDDAGAVDSTKVRVSAGATGGTPRPARAREVFAVARRRLRRRDARARARRRACLRRATRACRARRTTISSSSSRRQRSCVDAARRVARSGRASSGRCSRWRWRATGRPRRFLARTRRRTSTIARLSRTRRARATGARGSGASRGPRPFPSRASRTPTEPPRAPSRARAPPRASPRASPRAEGPRSDGGFHRRTRRPRRRRAWRCDGR